MFDYRKIRDMLALFDTLSALKEKELITQKEFDAVKTKLKADVKKELGLTS